MRRTILTSVLMDGEDALDSASCAAAGLIDGVSQDPLGQAAVEAGEALGGGVVDGEDEAEVDRVPETSCILDEGPPDRSLVAAEGAVSRPDSVQLAPLSVAQSFLPMRDVAHLVRRSLGVVVVVGLDEEHSAPLLLLGAGRGLQVSFRLGNRLLPLVGAHGAKLREQLVLGHLHAA